VDALHTRRCGPRCGYTSPDNRPEKSPRFACQACHVVLHADRVGARYVALSTLLARHDGVRTGVLSERPDVSRDDTKAARRQRSAELRWRLDTSPAL
jgi:transposase